MTRDEAFYAFGKATGDEQIGQCYPEMRRLGALPAPDAALLAPLREEVERLRDFVHRVGDFGNYEENGCACGVFRGCVPQHCIYAAARALAEGQP